MATMEEDLLKQGFVKEGESFVLRAAPTTGTVQTKKDEAPGKVQMQGTQAAPSISDYYKNFQTRKTEIEGIQDVEQRLNSLSSLQGEVAQHVAESTKEISATAEGLYGVPELEEMLKQNEAADRKDPKWDFNLVDSPMTAQVRNNLLQARQQARGKTAELLTQAPELMKLQAEADLFIKKEGQITSIMASKGAAQDQKDTLAIAQAGPNGVAVAKAINPSLQSDADAAAFFLANKGDKEMVKVADNWDNDQGLLAIAVSTDSGKALNAIATKQAMGRAGTDATLLQAEKDKALLELNKVREAMQDPAKRKAALAALYPSMEAMSKDAEMLSQDILMKVPGAEDRLKNLDVRAMSKILSDQRGAYLTSSIDNWDGATKQNLLQDPDMLEIINTAKTAGMPPSLEVLAGQIGKVTEPQRRTLLMDKLRNYAYKTVAYNNQGIYGQVPTSKIDAILNLSVASSAVKDSPGIAGLLKRLASGAVERAGTSYQENILGAAISPLTSMLQLLTTPLPTDTKENK